MIDLKHGVGSRDLAILEKLQRGKVSLVVALNKNDAVGKKEIVTAIDRLNENGVEQDIYPISAKKGDGVDELMVALKRFLTDGPMYYPHDMSSDQPERQIVAEIIREKALLHLSDEVPHGIGVVVESIAERKTKPLIDIKATLYCEREAHKGIIIGKSGAMLKKIGSESRFDIQMLFGRQVFLELFVRVKPGWRDDARGLSDFGYIE